MRPMIRKRTTIIAVVIVTGIYILTVGTTTATFYWKNYNSALSRPPRRLEVEAGAWYPTYEDRIAHGDSHVFRVPGSSGIQHDGLIDEIGSRTYYMLKTSAEKMWARVPVHLETTFKRFPNHQVYADGAGWIGNERVIDCIAMLPDEIKESKMLEEWRVRNEVIENGFGWDYTDVQIGKHGMSPSQDKFKILPLLLHAYLTAPKTMDWFVIADDDSYIISQSLGALLRQLDSNERLYIGSKSKVLGHLAETGRYAAKMKIKDPNSELSQTFAHGGSGIVLSRGLVESLFMDKHYNPKLIQHYSEVATESSSGDALLGFVIREELGVTCNENVPVNLVDPDPFPGESVFDTDVPMNTICQHLLSFHDIKPEEVQTLFEWESNLVDRQGSEDNSGVLYSNYYSDFVLPFLIPVRQTWDNGASEIEFKNGDEFTESEDSLIPAESPESCSNVCTEYIHCLMWRWMKTVSGDQVCGLAVSHVSRGISTSTVGHADNNLDYVSGWKIDRIREIRSQAKCDSLLFDPETNEFSDSPESSEGWFVKAFKSEQSLNKVWTWDWDELRLV